MKFYFRLLSDSIKERQAVVGPEHLVCALRELRLVTWTGSAGHRTEW
jgi:hypothetical protein